MGWKNWPSWLKGGLIGLLIAILYIGSLFLSNYLIQEYGIYCPGDRNCELTSTAKEFNSVVNFFKFPFLIPCSSCYQMGCAICQAYIAPPITLIEFFIIGALIGWIIGRIKSKKNIQNDIANSRDEAIELLKNIF